jgi:predicted dehydrogenase
MTDIRLGLLGAGRWGRRYIATIGLLDSVSLAVVFSRNPGTSDIVSSHCRIAQDWLDMLNGGDLDGVIIATPPAMHCEMVCAALEAGLPVLVEKPLTLSSVDSARIVEIADKFQRPVMVGHTHLFSPAFRKLKQLVATLGPIKSVKAEAGNDGPIRPDVTMLWDWAPHDIAMCIDLLGGPATLKSFRSHAIPRDPTGRADAIEVELDFASAVTASISISNMRQEKRRWLRVDCALGWVIYDDLASSKVRTGEPGDTVGRNVAIASDMPLTVAVAEFAYVCRNKPPGHPSLDQAVAVVALIERIEAAAQHQERDETSLT